MGAEAVDQFRRRRLADAQRMLLKEKKTAVDAANSESKTATSLRTRVLRASFDNAGGSRGASRQGMSRAGGRRSQMNTFSAGELDELQREVMGDLDNKSPNPAVSPSLPHLEVGGRRPSYDRPPTSGSGQAASAVPNSYNLPGLRPNAVATSPKSLRRLQSRSMGAAPRLPDHSGGFAHYSASLQQR